MMKLATLNFRNSLKICGKITIVAGYIAVKEYGEITKRVHFHFIVSYPFIDFRYFNDIWVNTISDICFYSSCAVRRTPGAPAIYATRRERYDMYVNI